MRKNKSAIIIGIIIFVGLGFLFALPKINDPSRSLAQVWQSAGVDCLSSHNRANLHIHPELQILVDGTSEVIPGSVGITKSCMAEVHTHDATGVIHLESVLVSKQFTLSDFFAVWGKDLTRPGFELELTVDGEPSQEFGNLILKDHQKIILRYTHK